MKPKELGGSRTVALVSMRCSWEERLGDVQLEELGVAVPEDGVETILFDRVQMVSMLVVGPVLSVAVP